MTAARAAPLASAPRHYEFHRDYASAKQPRPAIQRHDGGDQFAAFIRASLIGCDTVIPAPFGPRRLVYADWAASGRALRGIEDYVRTRVLPHYANTHTSASFTGAQTSLMRKEARELIGHHCHAGDDDAVIFAGSGATAAFSACMKFVDAHIAAHGESARAVFVLGPYHHHSVLLPLRERGHTVIEVDEDPVNGGPSMVHLATVLDIASRGEFAVKVGIFSAASNLSGVVADTDAVTHQLKLRGFLALWDYAAAASYVDVDMNPQRDPQRSKDAIILSPHKMIGGVSSPGVLIIKKRLLTNEVPLVPGGGTVFFVSPSSHRYLQNFEEREEGGTPDIVGAIRSGLAMQLKHQFDRQWRQQRVQHITATLVDRLSANPSIILAGHPRAPRVPLLSFLLRPRGYGGRFLHPNFVSVLLNDLFGVQSRSGCMCAGVYAHRCLGLNDADSVQLERALLARCEILRPGFTRLSCHCATSDEDVNFLCDAVEFIADHGARFLSLYGFHVDTGEFKHRSRMNKFVGRHWLSECDFGIDTVIPPAETAPDAAVMLVLAHQAALEADAAANSTTLDASQIASEFESLRWFALPQDRQDSTTDYINSTLILQPGIPIQPTATTSAAATTAILTLPMNLLQIQSSPTNKPIVAAPITVIKPVVEDIKCMTCPTPHASQPESLTDSRCRTCYHFHHTGSDRGRCSACDCVHFAPMIATASAATATTRHSVPSARVELLSVSKKLHSMIGSAIRDHTMITSGDRVLVGVSGGKDSLTLIHVLLALQKKSPVKFAIGAVTVDPSVPEYDPSPLIAYFASINVPYFYERQAIVAQAQQCMTGRTSICAYCARMKRGILYNACRREGYNVLALGQHADDLAESTLMSLFHNGRLRTMKANYAIASGDLRVIRPMVTVREKFTRAFARLRELPVIPESCPACFEAPKERARIKKLLAAQEAIHPTIISNIIRAIEPLVAIRRTGSEGRCFLYQATDEEERASDEDEDQPPLTEQKDGAVAVSVQPFAV